MMAILILSLLTSPLNSILMATVHSGQTLSVQSLFFALHPFISTSSLPFFPPSSLFCPSVVSLSDPCKINTWRLQRKDIWIVHMEYEIWTVFSLVIFSVSDGFDFSAAKGQRKKSLKYTYQVWRYYAGTILEFILKDWTAPHPKARRHWSIHVFLQFAHSKTLRPQTSLNQNMETWGTFKTSNFPLSPACLRVKTKQWTIERRVHEEQILGTESERKEERERRESKPLMSKTFLFGEGA